MTRTKYEDDVLSQEAMESRAIAFLRMINNIQRPKNFYDYDELGVGYACGRGWLEFSKGRDAFQLTTNGESVLAALDKVPPNAT